MTYSAEQIKRAALQVEALHDEAELARREFNLKYYAERKPAIQARRCHELAGQKYLVGRAALRLMRNETEENQANLDLEMERLHIIERELDEANPLSENFEPQPRSKQVLQEREHIKTVNENMASMRRRLRKTLKV